VSYAAFAKTRWSRAWLAVWPLVASPQAVAADAPAPLPIIITAAAVIDGLAAKPRQNAAVVVCGNRIVAIGDGDSKKLPAEAQRIDLSAATLLPGLIDAHTHLFLQGELNSEGGYDAQLLMHPLSFRAARAVVAARRALEQGFTTLRDVETEGAGYGDVGIKEAIEAGYWYVPTLAVYYKNWDLADTPNGRRDRKRATVHGPSFSKALKAGVKIAFGTDVGGFPWSEPIAQEFAREVEFGMTPMQAIQAATNKAAELLGMQGQVGVIAPGAYADLMAAKGDPLANVAALEQVEFVMRDGRVFKSPAHDAR